MVSLSAPFRAIADFALPPRCPECGALTAADHRFCADCWRALRFVGPPWCALCCAPFAFDRGDDAVCAKCLDDPPPHDGTRAAVAYGPVAKTVALRLKYAGRTAFAQTAARMMLRALPSHAELLVPVPLDRWRLWGRGYNQAALIADALTRLSGVPTARAALVRTRASGGMRGLNPRQRRAAVKGAFAVPDRSLIAGRSIIIVDDVQATGATVAGCARVLTRAGAARVGVLCWARVLDGDAA
ncbi:MAG: ComF family protein [Pseudomonadota bacterium]